MTRKVPRTVSSFSPLVLRCRFGGSSSNKTEISDSLFCDGTVRTQGNEPNTANCRVLTSPDASFTSGIRSAFGRFCEGWGFVGLDVPTVSSSPPSESTILWFDFFREDAEVRGLEVDGSGSVSSRSVSMSS